MKNEYNYLPIFLAIKESDRDKITTTKISELTGYSQQSVSRIINELIEMGFVSRTNKNVVRGYVYYITDKGKNWLKNIAKRLL